VRAARAERPPPCSWAALAPGKELAFYEREYARLEALLIESHERSTLPDETPGARDALDTFLRELRF
jgi:hypothetical protein